MRRDVSFYVEAPVQTVYQAYLSAATHPPFSRDCKQEPFYCISFGVNYSFKYNMNGGACTIRFMPYGTGTAVNMRFSIAQLVGARYTQYAEDLNRAMQAFLPVAPRSSNFNSDDFERIENQVTAATVTKQPSQVASTPAAAPQPEVVEQPQAKTKFCTKCGTLLTSDARFCSNCGNAIESPNTCPSCGAIVQKGASFCSSCGTHI